MEPNPEIGRYRLVERLFPEGEVWGAEDLEDPGTRVLVKFVDPDADLFGYRQQGNVLAELELPGIVAPIDSGETADGRPFFVFPYVDGLTLRDALIEGGPMGFRRAGHILQQLGEMLAATHGKHIAHGALDPEHILLTRNDKVHLINFGAWRISASPSTPIGYLAPEAKTGQVTASGDIFSLAAIAAEMLTGRRAFRYGSEQDLARQQRIGVARGSIRQLRREIPLRVEEEIRRGLSWDPAHRPGDAQVFANRIAEGLTERRAMPMRRVLLFAGLMAALAGSSAYRACKTR